MELHTLSIREAQDLLSSRQISSIELTTAVLDHIHKTDQQINAFVTLADEMALDQARLADTRLKSGDNVSHLTGIPFAVKDCISTKNLRTTCSSKILENYIPQYNATVIDRLAGSGAVLLGKHNMDEFGMGSSCENSAFFNTHNPWDMERVPGGSSGGSAAAVASNMGFFALGEDTGGSIRMPASFCNVTGLKTTYGRVSRYGLIALVSSFDSIGPMARSAYDCAIVLQAIAGQDSRDATSLPGIVPDYVAKLDKPVKDLRLGIPKEYFQAGMEPGVEASIREAIRKFEELGMQIREISLPHTQYGLPVYYLILFAEASANLARFDGTRFGLSVDEGAQNVIDLYLQTRREGFGPEVKRRIMLGAYVLSAGYYDAYYLKAQRVRTLLRQDFETAFEQCDALVAPICPTTAFKIGEKTTDPLTMYLSDIYTVATNPAGVPSLSVPCGFSNGMPVGMQLIGRHLSEDVLLQIGHAFQSVTDWHLKHPPSPSGRRTEEEGKGVR
jgi:aspartyl-tRNA(Asn)/glutamyl-tRNA(Gln) amidotransferase subunit A